VAKTAPEPETSVPPTTPAPATPTLEPVAVATPPPATPAPELAPPGVFYLIAAARVETSDGIVGLKPGTGVKLVRPGIYLTPAGEVSLNPEQMTNDLALARRVASADSSAQAAVKSALAAQAATALAEEKARGGGNTTLPAGARSTTFTTVTTGTDGRQTVRETSVTTHSSTDPVTARLKELSQQSQMIGMQITNLRAEMRKLSNADPKTSPSAARLQQQIDGLKERQRSLDRQMIP